MNFKICISCFDNVDYEYSVKGLISALSLMNLTEEQNIKIELYTNKVDFYGKLQSLVDSKISLVYYEGDTFTPKYHKINNFHSMIVNSVDEKIDYIMFIDADTLVVKNIFNVIRQNYRNLNYELLIAHELNTKIGTDQVINYNSGLLFVRPTSTIFQVIKDWLKTYGEEVKICEKPLAVHDQPHLRQAIKRYNPIVGTLPKNCNYRGHEAQGFTDWLWDDIFVMHNHEMYRSSAAEALWKNINAVDYNKINALTLSLISKIKRINTSLKPNSCSLVVLASSAPRKIYFMVKIIVRYLL